MEKMNKTEIKMKRLLHLANKNERQLKKLKEEVKAAEQLPTTETHHSDTKSKKTSKSTIAKYI